MKRLLRILLPLAVLALGFGVCWWLIATAPEPGQRAFRLPPPVVEVGVLEHQSYPVLLRSQGTVRARTESTLAAEVRGRILAIAPGFREGGFFEEGDVLVRIDPVDYETELVTAEANLAQVELRLFEERARTEQARLDWERLNPGTTAGELALREPQLRLAETAVASARARVESARRDLERTQVRAPYAGRILAKNADVGQYVTPGAVLARIFAIDYAEVRLPLTESQLAHLDLREVYRGEFSETQDGPPVTLRAVVAGRPVEWRGRIVRAEGSLDVRTRQLSVVAQITDPYGRGDDDRPPLKIGSFVEAVITGRTLERVFVLPRRILRENQYVLVVEDGKRLRRRPVAPVWSDGEEIVVRDELRAGESICLTQVPYAVDGMEVALSNAAPAAPGGPADRLLAALPAERPLPPALRAKLEAAAGDMAATRAVIGEIRTWAREQGIELPAPGGPR